MNDEQHGPKIGKKKDEEEILHLSNRNFPTEKNVCKFCFRASSEAEKKSDELDRFQMNLILE